MRPTIYPPQTVTQCVEDTMGLASADRLPQTLPTAADEKRRFQRSGSMSCAQTTLTRQSGDGTGVQWQLARLGKLGLPHGKHPASEVNIGIAQMNGLRNTPHLLVSSACWAPRLRQTQPHPRSAALVRGGLALSGDCW